MSALRWIARVSTLPLDSFSRLCGARSLDWAKSRVAAAAWRKTASRVTPRDRNEVGSGSKRSLSLGLYAVHVNICEVVCQHG
jgi:hypothetical protein